MVYHFTTSITVCSLFKFSQNIKVTYISRVHRNWEVLILLDLLFNPLRLLHCIFRKIVTPAQFQWTVIMMKYDTWKKEITAYFTLKETRINTVLYLNSSHLKDIILWNTSNKVCILLTRGVARFWLAPNLWENICLFFFLLDKLSNNAITQKELLIITENFLLETLQHFLCIIPLCSLNHSEISIIINFFLAEEIEA